jgi:hypothetical protein
MDVESQITKKERKKFGVQANSIKFSTPTNYKARLQISQIESSSPGEVKDSPNVSLKYAFYPPWRKKKIHALVPLTSSRTRWQARSRARE